MRKLAVVLALILVPLATARAQSCPGVAPWVFVDVAASHAFCTYVTWMAQTGVTTGCRIIDANNREYCPDDNVTRLQMAAFMSRLGRDTVFADGGNAFGAPAVLGTTDNQALDLRVNGSRVMRYEPNAISPNVIGGNPANSVTAGVRGATIGGGGVAAGTDPDYVNEAPNRVTDHYGTVGGGYNNQAGDAAGTAFNGAFATVGGGYLNTASGHISTVGGGYGNTATSFSSAVGGGYVNTASGSTSTVGGGDDNTASGSASTVGGGGFNTASGVHSTIGGGYNNTASGGASTIGGGGLNTASGDYSFAAGLNAQANQDRCFIFGGWSTGGSISCLGAANIVRFGVDRGLSVEYYSRRSDGGGNRWFHVGDLIAGQTIATWTGAWLSDAGVWVNASSSRTSKTDFAAVDPGRILDEVTRLPITTWRYREGEGEVRHIGPMAEDFHAAFGVGYGPHTIADLDARGVALAAIQGLNEKLEARIAEQADDLARVKSEVAALRELLRDAMRAR